MSNYKKKNYYNLLVITFLCSSIWVNFNRKLYANKNIIKFEHFSLEQVFSKSTVYCIVRDIRGFMWYGTEDELKKYVGHNFTIYKFDPDDPNSLSNNDVFSI